jgi:hypothetical protein
MKHIATMVLMLGLGVASVHAQERPVRMKFSGSMVPTSIVVQPNSITDEELLAGDGALGSFTFRKLRTDALAPQPSSACPGLNIPVLAAGGVFRFQDGSLLTVGLKEPGALCIVPPQGHLTETYEITGGTGRFRGATGSLTLKATLSVVMVSNSGQPVLLTSTGTLEGTVDAPGIRDEQ